MPQAAGNAVAFLGCSSASFQAGTNCVGCRGVSEKWSGVGAGVSARGVAFQAMSPGQIFQNPSAPTVSMHTPFRGCQSGCDGPAASQGIQHGCSSQPAPISTHLAHKCMQGLCQGLRGTFVFRVLGVGPQRGQRLGKDCWMMCSVPALVFCITPSPKECRVPWSLLMMAGVSLPSLMSPIEWSRGAGTALSCGSGRCPLSSAQSTWPQPFPHLLSPWPHPCHPAEL